eukprot:6721520-Alexandrium_andersonii.AAC.1
MTSRETAGCLVRSCDRQGASKRSPSGTRIPQRVSGCWIQRSSSGSSRLRRSSSMVEIIAITVRLLSVEYGP